MTSYRDGAPDFFDRSRLLGYETGVPYGALALIAQETPEEYEHLRASAHALVTNVPDMLSMNQDERNELAADSRALSDEQAAAAAGVLLLGACIVMNGKFVRNDLPDLAHAQYYPATNKTSISTAIRDQLHSKVRSLRQSEDAAGVEITLSGLEDFKNGLETINFEEAYLAILQYRLRALKLGSIATKTLAYVDSSISKKYKEEDAISTLDVNDERRLRLLDSHDVERLGLKNVNSVKAQIKFWVNEGCLEGSLEPGPLGITGKGRDAIKQLQAIFSVKPQLAEMAEVAQAVVDFADAGVPAEILDHVARINAGFQYLRDRKRGRVPDNIDAHTKYGDLPAHEVAVERSKLAQLEVVLNQKLGVPKGVFAQAGNRSKAA